MITPNKNQKGQALILIAFAIVGLVGITALAIDGGNAFSVRRHAQNAADAAALAGSLEITQDVYINQEGAVKYEDYDGDDINFYNAAMELANENGFFDLSPESVTISSPPGPGCEGDTNGPYFGVGSYANIGSNYYAYVQVVIYTQVETYFGGVVGIDKLDVCVESVSRAEPGYVAPLYNGNSIVALDPTGCGAVTYQGTVDSFLVEGGIFINSSCTPDAFSNSSASANLCAPSVTAVGGIDMSGLTTNCPIGYDYESTQIEGAVQESFPPDYALPNPGDDCGNEEAEQYGMWMSPGNYDGNTFPPAGVANLEPGLYCVFSPGGFILRNSDTLSGYGVTIILMEGMVDWTGSALGIHLHAPNPICAADDDSPECNNKYNGLLMYIPETNTQANQFDCGGCDGITWNGNSGWDLTGTVLAPWTNIKINGTEEGFSLGSQVIGFDIKLSGNGQINMTYDSSDNWMGPWPSKLELSR